MTKEIERTLDLIQEILLSLLIKLGPFFVALMPSMFTGYSIYYSFEESAGHRTALTFAFVVAVAVETVEIVITHIAVSLYNGWQERLIQPAKFWVMATMVPIAALTISLTIANSGEAFEPLIRSLGIASPFLTVMVNMAVALSRDLKGAVSKREREEAEIRQEKAVQKERRHQEKLAKATVKNSSNSTVKDDNLTQINASRDEQKKRQMDNLIGIYLDNPEAGVSQVARQVGLSRQTVYNYLGELESGGVIHRNGDGVRVLK